MTKATNSLGFEIQEYSNVSGWRRTSAIMGTKAEAQAALALAIENAAADATARGTVDTLERRWFESLAGFQDLAVVA
jgi:hypothetical protein